MGSGTSSSGAVVPNAVASTATTTDWNVDKNQTVQGQMTGLLNENSDYMKAARTGALQQANKSGLLNSSMAAGAGQLAAIQSALPIAQQDASTFANAGQFNAKERNASSQWNAGNQTDVSKFNAAGGLELYKQREQFGQQKEMFALDEGLKKWMVGEDAKLKTALTQMDLGTKKELATIEADYKTLMQTSASAADIYKGSLAAMAQIMSSDMDEAAKASALNSTINLMKSSMNILGSVNGIDLTDLLDFGQFSA